MALSVHTNKSAMVALQNLNRTNRELDEVQVHLNTGLKIAGAKDNAAVFAVAQNMRSDLGAYSAVQTSLDRASSIAEPSVRPWRFAPIVTARWRSMRVIADGAAPVWMSTRLRSSIGSPLRPRT